MRLQLVPGGEAKHRDVEPFVIEQNRLVIARSGHDTASIRSGTNMYVWSGMARLSNWN
jgi:hypothetical protein